MFIQTSFFNPYHNQTFCEFILMFIHRMAKLMTGQLSFQQLASDEIQVLVLIGVAISSALVGTFLVLRRMTMLANSLSHTILMGIVLAFFIFFFIVFRKRKSFLPCLYAYDAFCCINNGIFHCFFNRIFS